MSEEERGELARLRRKVKRLEIERDLDQAQLSIDMLDMLEAKTRGNLTDEEKKYLGEVLKELKLNYVDEKAKDKPDEKATNKPDEKESK